MSNEIATAKNSQDILKLYNISINGLQRMPSERETNVIADWSYVNVHKRVPPTESDSESIEIVSLYSACDRDEPEQKGKTLGLAKPIKKEWHSFSHLMELQGSNMGRFQELKKSDNLHLMERTASFSSFVYSDFDHKSEISVSSPAFLPLPMFGEELSKAFRNRTNNDSSIEPLGPDETVDSLPDLDLEEGNCDSANIISKPFESNSAQDLNGQIPEEYLVETKAQALDEYAQAFDQSDLSENHVFTYNEFDKLDSLNENSDNSASFETEDKETNTFRSIFEPVILYLNLSDKTLLKISEFERFIFPNDDESPDSWYKYLQVLGALIGGYAAYQSIVFIRELGMTTTIVTWATVESAEALTKLNLLPRTDKVPLPPHARINLKFEISMVTPFGERSFKVQSFKWTKSKLPPLTFFPKSAIGIVTVCLEPSGLMYLESGMYCESANLDWQSGDR